MLGYPSDIKSTQDPSRSTERAFILLYWTGMALLLIALALAAHVYFEYRNMELDRRLEKLQGEGYSTKLLPGPTSSPF